MTTDRRTEISTRHTLTTFVTCAVERKLGLLLPDDSVQQLARWCETIDPLEDYPAVAWMVRYVGTDELVLVEEPYERSGAPLHLADDDVVVEVVVYHDRRGMQAEVTRLSA